MAAREGARELAALAAGTPPVELLTHARAIYSVMRDESPSMISSGIYKRSRMYVLYYIPRALQQPCGAVHAAASATGEREKAEYKAPATIPVLLHGPCEHCSSRGPPRSARARAAVQR